MTKNFHLFTIKLSEIGRRILLPALFLASGPVAAQTAAGSGNWMTSPGIIGTITLLIVVVMVGVLIISARFTSYVDQLKINNRI